MRNGDAKPGQNEGQSETVEYQEHQKAIKLSKSTTIAGYQNLVKSRDRNGITEFIQDRFRERYISPLKAIHPDKKHGFCVMAISCLMIEALESFWQGWPDTEGKSKRVFKSFFRRYDAFGVFQEFTDVFYRHVRCGILHQAETTGGWRIVRKGPLLDVSTKTINATRFHELLENCLIEYCEKLRHSSWDSDLWKKLRTKMEAICSNCLA